jgi:hypothetical protein
MIADRGEELYRIYKMKNLTSMSGFHRKLSIHYKNMLIYSIDSNGYDFVEGFLLIVRLTMKETWCHKKIKKNNN